MSSPWFKIFFKMITHAHSGLPYNINWRRRDWRKIVPILDTHPIHVTDIGARDGIPDELLGLEGFLNYVACDADEREAARISVQPHVFRRLTVIPAYIGSTNGKQSFFLYKNLGESSSLRPNKKYTQFFPNLAIDREVAVEAVTLDALLSSGKIEDVDILKLDTQGNEYDILESGGQALDRALMVEAEVEYVPVYEGQKLAFDIERLMYEKGFEILYINRVFLSRRVYKGDSRGQIIFGDILFGLNETKAHELSVKKKLTYIVLLIQYGHLDLAFSLYEKSTEVQKMAPALRTVFAPRRSFNRNITDAISMQIDKVIAFLLYLRRSNHLRTDSDRNWPYR